MALDVRSYELIVVERDLPWLLGQWVRRSPDKPFLIWAPHEGAHESWTYRAFDDAVRRVAAGLASIGVSRGDKVHIHLENCAALLFAYFACARLGAVAVMGNTRSSKAEVQHYLNLVSPLIVVTQREYTPHFAGFDGDLVLVDDESGTAPSKSELLTSEPLEGDRPREPMLDLRVQFTSGTTSRPKAVLSTHANTLFSAQQTALAYALRTDDICQVFVPLFHNNGLATLVMSTLWSGGTVLLQP
ncbi:MAG: acyl--CoA ligase, partial [Pseudomonadales bacterium]|nr:acyl--CoA ligase [Pseudomonadales bacterium]